MNRLLIFVITFLIVFNLNDLFASNSELNELQDRCIDITFKLEGYSGKNPRQLYAYFNSLDVKSEVEKFIAKPFIDNPWFRMKTPHLVPRTIGLYQAIYNSIGFYNLQSELAPPSSNWLDKAIEFYSPEGLERIKNMPLRSGLNHGEYSEEELKKIILKKRDYDETGLGKIFKNYSSLTSLLCSNINPTSISQCAQAMKYTYKNLYEYGDSYNLGNGWLVDVLLSDIAAPGAFNLNYKILKRIKENDFQNANLIEDAYESFKGTTKDEFTDRYIAETFLLLSLVHGQLSWESYRLEGYIQKFNHRTLTAAYMLSMISATMDSLVYKNSSVGEIYILPNKSVNVCDNGKAYHSIVPWYLSKRLKAKKYSDSTASIVPFYFDWIYQALSTSRGRFPEQNVKEAYDSVLNQSHRLDLMFAGIGSIYGANSDEKTSVYDMTKAFNVSQEKVDEKYKNGFDVQRSDVLKILKINNKRSNPNKILSIIKN